MSDATKKPEQLTVEEVRELARVLEQENANLRVKLAKTRAKAREYREAVRFYALDLPAAIDEVNRGKRVA